MTWRVITESAKLEGSFHSETLDGICEKTAKNYI